MNYSVKQRRTNEWMKKSMSFFDQNGISDVENAWGHYKTQKLQSLNI